MTASLLQKRVRGCSTGHTIRLVVASRTQLALQERQCAGPFQSERKIKGLLANALPRVTELRWIVKSRSRSRYVGDEHLRELNSCGSSLRYNLITRGKNHFGSSETVSLTLFSPQALSHPLSALCEANDLRCRERAGLSSDLVPVLKQNHCWNAGDRKP